MDLKELYREVILDHNRSPRNFGRVEPADASAAGHNPLCGDRLDVSVRLDGERLADVRFEGQGCAISVASASLMTEAVRGHDVAGAQHLHQRFRAVLTGELEPDVAQLGKLISLAGVRRYPGRIKCALLGWHALMHALGDTP